MDEAINETGTVMAQVVEDNGEQLRAADQKFCTEVNSLSAMDGRDRPLVNQLLSTVVSCRIFIRSQSLIVR